MRYDNCYGFFFFVFNCYLSKITANTRLPPVPKIPAHLRTGLNDTVNQSRSSNTTATSLQLRHPWTDDETERLYLATQSIGIGKWAYIKDRAKLTNRTSVNVKDRWRTIVKNGQVKLLGAKFGPVDK